jgi:organic radical activating enzyme
MLRVSRMPSGEPEIFRSIQGEGVTAGTPSIFLRLATCNLACTWCDTKYTWDWKRHDYDREVVTLEPDDVEERVVSLGCPRLVITGGEPLLQQRTLFPLVLRLRERGFYCEVETNGTLSPEPGMVDAVSQWNVSPKLANSGDDAVRREVPDALRAFRDLPNAYFKFVVVEPSDVDEVCTLAERYDIPAGRVLLMPEGITPDIVGARGTWLAKVCAERGFRFTTRLHILLWGDERGH